MPSRFGAENAKLGIVPALGTNANGGGNHMSDTMGHLEANEKRIEMRIRAEMLGSWEELWRAIKEMEPGLGDANKPLAIAASYALLVKERDDLKQHLIRHQAVFGSEPRCDAKACPVEGQAEPVIICSHCGDVSHEPRCPYNTPKQARDGTDI